MKKDTVLILDCIAANDSPRDLNYSGEDPHDLFREKAGGRMVRFASERYSTAAIEVVCVEQLGYEELCDLLIDDSLKAIVISGSSHSINDEVPFVKNLIKALQTMKDKISAEVFGICFGLHALNVAAGGKVGCLTDSGKGEYRKGFRTLADGTTIYVNHTEHITELAPGAVDLNHCEDHVLYQARFPGFGEGVQHHVEVSVA